MIIATRRLRIVTASGQREMETHLHAPRLSGDDCICDYEIEWPDGARRYAGHGADSLQALVIAMQMIGAELYTSEAHREGRLSAPDGVSDDGFPVTASLRDLLTKSDREFL